MSECKRGFMVIRVTCVLPELILASSKIHGLGLFAAHDLTEGCYATEYGGEYVTKTDAMRMMNEF